MIVGSHTIENPGLINWLKTVQNRMKDARVLNKYVGTALMTGGELNGASLKGIPQYIRDTAPSKHAWSKRLNAEPTNEYEGAAKGATLIDHADYAGVAFTRGAKIFAHWQKDVTIVPGPPFKWLPVPNLGIAYGKRPESFGDKLAFEPRTPELAVLVWKRVKSRREKREAKEQTTAAGPAKAATAAKPAKAKTATSTGESEPGKDARPQVVYWLKKKVRLKKDETLLPPIPHLIKLAGIGVRECIANLPQHPIP